MQKVAYTWDGITHIPPSYTCTYLPPILAHTSLLYLHIPPSYTCIYLPPILAHTSLLYLYMHSLHRLVLVYSSSFSPPPPLPHQVMPPPVGAFFMTSEDVPRQRALSSQAVSPLIPAPDLHLYVRTPRAAVAVQAAT